MPTINSAPQLSSSQQQYINSGSEAFAADHVASPLEILQNVYKELNPQYGTASGAEEMSTAVLVQKLENISRSESRAKTAPEDKLYELLNNAFLRKTLVLKPNVDSPFYDDSKKRDAIKLSYKNLLSRLGGKLLIKGSSISAIKQNRLFGGNNAKQDLDAYIVVPNLSDKLTIGKLVKAFRSVSDFHDSSLSDDELISLYTRENTNSNQAAGSPGDGKLAFLRKFRLNVDLDQCIPIDLCFFTELPAEFDRLGKGSDQIRVDIHSKTATERVLLDEYVQDWLEAQKYIWLHDGMTNGLIRIQKHFKKTPDLRLLQSGIIGKHYDQAAPLERLSFIKAILDEARKKIEPPPRLARALSGLAEEIVKLPLGDRHERSHQEILSDYMRSSLNSSAISNPDHALTIGKSLLNCLRVTKGFSKFFYKILKENMALLPSGRQIDTVFPNPILADLSSSWSNVGALEAKRSTVNSAKQISTLLEPVTLKVLGDYLVKAGHSVSGADGHQQHSDLIDLLFHVANKEENAQQRIQLLALKLATFDDKDAKKETINSLISLAKTLSKPTDTADPISASKAEILNALASQLLRGKQLAEVKKLYADALLCQGEDIAKNVFLNEQAKRILLLWQLQTELDAFVALSVTQDLAPPIGEHSQFASLDAYEHRALCLRAALGTLQDISHDVKLDDQCYPVVLNTGAKAVVLSSADHRCLITDDYLHMGKFKLKQKKGGKDEVIIATIKGKGVQWRNTQQLHVGEFEGAQLSGVGKVLTKKLVFNGEVSEDRLGVGSMMLADPGSLKAELALITAFINSDGRLHETLEYTPKKRSSIFQYSLNGDFDGCSVADLTEVCHHDFPDLKIGVTNADVILAVEREDGHCLKGYIDKHEGEAGRYLCFPLALDGDGVVHILADSAAIVDPSTQKRVCGTLDMETQRIEGSGCIDSLVDDYIHYYGTLINFTPTGFGRLFTEDAPAGVYAYREAGRVVDPELADLIKAENFDSLPWRMRPQQTLLYDLPGYDGNTLFCLLDESGNKVFGVWSQGHIIGHMRKVSGSQKRESTGVMFSLPETICRFAEEIGINFGDQGLVMKDKKGMQHRFIPIGNHTVEEVDASSKLKSKIETSIVGYALGRALPQPFTAFGVGHESAALSGSQSTQYAVINKVNGLNSIYIGETTMVKRSGKLHPIPHGKGISVSSTQLYQGHYKDGAITGAARSVGVDGSRFRGIYKHSEPTFGEMTLLNGIKTTGAFKADEAWGAVKMVIPSYPKERTFEFKVDDGLITDSVKEILDGGRKVLVDVKARDESRSQPTTMDLVYRVLFESKIRIEADQRNDTLLPLSKEYSVFIDTVRESLNFGT